MFDTSVRRRHRTAHRVGAPHRARGGADGPLVAAGAAAAYATAEDPTPDERQPAGERGRAALARLTEAPGASPLAQAVALLADAVESLGAVDADVEHVDDLGDAALAMHHLRSRLDAALLGVLAGFDRREGYRHDGAVTCGSWLRWRTNIGYGAASTLVQAARRLAHLPRFTADLAAGDVTLAHVTAVTRAAVPQRAAAVAAAEPILAGLARTSTPQDLRRALRCLADLADPDGSDPPDDEDAGEDCLRELTLRAGFQGRGELEATLDPLTREALTVLLDAFTTPDPPGTPPARRRSAAQRRHDAFAGMLHTLLAQPGLPSVQGARPQILVTIDLAVLLGLPPGHPAAGVTLADLADMAGIDLAAFDHAFVRDGDDEDGEPDAPDHGQTGAGTDHGDGDTPDDGEPDAWPGDDAAPGDAGEPRDAGDTDDGVARPAPHPAPAPVTRPARFGSGVEIHPAAVRGLLAAATVMVVLTLGPWRAVNVGAKHRTLPAWLRAVLAAIHRHCRGPDCDRPASWTQAHHITGWTEAHSTDLNDSLPLCAAHHDLITTKGWTAALDHSSGAVTWTSPDGRSVTVPPPRP